MPETETPSRPLLPPDGPPWIPGEPSAPVEERSRLRFPDVFLLALVPLVCALVAMRLDGRLQTGPSWDTYAFLDNAADMAGRSVGYLEPHRPPMLPFLTSLFLRAGAWNVATIQLIDGGLAVVGVIAFYLLLRRRFERPLSMMASALLLMVPPLWAWLGSGYTDFPSVAVSILAMLLVVKGTEDDPRWYWVAFPMVLFAILTRFGAFLMIVPVVLWMVLRAKPFQQWKQIVTGLVLTAVAYVPAGGYFAKYFSDPFFPFGFAAGVAGAGVSMIRTGKPTTFWASLPGSFFVSNIEQLLLRNKTYGQLGTVFLAVTALGLVTALVVTLARQRPFWRWLLPIVVAVLVAVAEVKAGAMLRVFLITVLGFVVARCIVPADADDAPSSSGGLGWGTFRGLDPAGRLALDATMLVWGLLFFDAHGHMQPQVDRYFITMAPVALYFVALGWRSIGASLVAPVAFVARRLTTGSGPSWRIPVVIGTLGLAVMVGMGAFAIVERYESTVPDSRDSIVMGAEKTAVWLLAHDKNLRRRVVYSDVWPLTSWYLGMEAYPMPTFESSKAFPHELEKNRVDYFVTIRGRRYPGYRTVYGAGSTSVLKYESSFPRALPAVLYFGDGWDAYAEQLCNFDFNLFFSSRRQIGTGTWMLDAMTPKQLAAYDAVAIFGTHWRNKGAAEKTLRTYVENGGVAIIDASRNMDGFSYPMVDTVFMDVVVRRSQVASSAVMTVSPVLADYSRVATSFAPAPFRDERGGPWYAAGYAPSPWARTADEPSATYETLASMGSDPIVLVQRIGKGRIYWLGGNLLWHGYWEGNQDDIRLIRGIFRQATGLPPIPAAEVAASVKPWFISKKLRPPKVPGAPKPTTAASGTVSPMGSPMSQTRAAALRGF